jgi:hypothetical protein
LGSIACVIGLLLAWLLDRVISRHGRSRRTQCERQARHVFSACRHDGFNGAFAGR